MASFCHTHCVSGVSMHVKLLLDTAACKMIDLIQLMFFPLHAGLLFISLYPITKLPKMIFTVRLEYAFVLWMYVYVCVCVRVCVYVCVCMCVYVCVCVCVCEEM